MHSTVRFIHAADLHLGAPLRGLREVSERWAERLLVALAEAYDNVVQAAIDNEVDFVIIAGDIFDTARSSYGDYLHFFEGLRRLERAGIASYLCTGNHDPYTSWQHDFDKLPAKTTMFSADRPSFALFEKDGDPLCLLGGRSFYSPAWPSDQCIIDGISREAAIRELTPLYPRASEAPFSVGVIHTGLHFDRAKAPADIEDLLRSDIDYWACGHIHKRYVLPEEGNPRVVYPGCVQGRDIQEEGQRGCYLVTLEEGQPNKVRFIPTASVAWARLEVDVSDCLTIADIHRNIKRRAFGVSGLSRCAEMCFRVKLVGVTPLHGILARPGIIDDIRASLNRSLPSFFCDAIADSTIAPRNMAALKEEGLFPAHLIEVADEQYHASEEGVAFLENEFLGRNIQTPSNLPRMFDRLVKEAEHLALDYLAGEEQ